MNNRIRRGINERLIGKEVEDKREKLLNGRIKK